MQTQLFRFCKDAAKIPLLPLLTLFRMGLFGAGGGGSKRTPSLLCQSYTLPKEDQTNIWIT